MIDGAKHPVRMKNSVIAQAYRPIIRGYFAVVAAYYAVMTATHFWLMGGQDLALLAATSIIGCVGAVGAYCLATRQIAVGQLEVLINTINLLILANVLVALHVDFNQVKLVYFIMMAMIFAFASVSMRQALISVLIALVGLVTQVSRFDPGNLEVFAFLSFAAALSAVAIAYFLRRAIGLAIAAREQADEARRVAEERLAKSIELSEKMRLQSMSDSLTGLSNRRAFYARLDEGRLQSDTAEGAWLILLDLDGFKAVNDNHGHLMGDELLKAVAQRLTRFCDGLGFVSRIGGDEFSIILFGDRANVPAEDWSGELLQELAQVYAIEGRLIQISGSIGCRRIRPGIPDAQLVQEADFALMHAKRNGKNRVVMFEGQHAEKAAEHFRIERALRSADFDTELELVFQPQFGIDGSGLRGAEVLARWNSPSIGRIGPHKFISIAEETGLITNITRTVLQKALVAQAEHSITIPLSVNLSGSDLNSKQTIDDLIECLERARTPARLIEFEITETAMMSDVDRARTNLQRLVDRGHPIALDDFGTGYSNFSYLRTLPIDKLKIDRSFLERKSDPMTERILHSLVGLAHTLNVHCLLEGIETELDLMMAKRTGIQSVQGYMFGRPMKVLQLASLIRNRGEIRLAG